jgi:lipopolysaccharide exporter
LLTPADFGLLAMAMFVVSLLEVASQAGLEVFVIRHPDPQRSHFDTMWTLHLAIGAVLAVAVLLLAPAGAAFFHEPKIAGVMRVLALRPLLNGLENPKIILFRRNMTFHKEFEFFVTTKICSFVLTIALALALRNYWALVFGILGSGAISLLQSYRLQPYLPRFSLSEAGAAWRISGWMLLQNVLRFLNVRVDELIIGRFKTITLMGYYSVAADVAASPIDEIMAPLERVLFPGLVRIANDPAALAATFAKVLEGVAIAAFSISVGIALVAGDLTRLFLGPQWLPAIPLLRVLALSAGVLMLAQPQNVLLNASGGERVATALTLVRQVLLVSAMVPMAAWHGLEAVALARGGAALATLAITMFVQARLMNVSVAGVWLNLLRPAAAAAMMAGVVLLVQRAPVDPPVLHLALAVATGVVSYTGALLLLWRLAGAPDTFEHDLILLALSPRNPFGRHLQRFRR